MSAFLDFDYSWLTKVFSLAVLPFAHEDLAIVMGGYIVVNHTMPLGVVLATIYFGMVASDFALYGIGAGARLLPWLNHWAVNDRVRNFGDALKRNLFGLTALCRIVPGMVFVAFVACGWSRVPLARFALASLLVSALYLPLMLYLVVVFGDALDDHAGVWAWPFILGLVVATGFMRYRVFTLNDDRSVQKDASRGVSGMVRARAKAAQKLARSQKHVTFAPREGAGGARRDQAAWLAPAVALEGCGQARANFQSCTLALLCFHCSAKSDRIGNLAPYRQDVHQRLKTFYEAHP